MIEKAKSIMSLLKNNGASNCFIVGGFVRDSILGIESKDIDIEVYGMSLKQIVAALNGQHKVDLVGESFGVVKVDNEIDVSVPRRDNKIGAGHKGFEIEFDPSMTPEEAASRRDFTINSMFMDVSGKIYDPFFGQDHLRDGILIHTSNAFTEDPLRVLRGMQFASRFSMFMHKDTRALCMDMANSFTELPKERIWTEWEKWALKGESPSDGLQVLLDTRWLSLFPELAALDGCPQDPQHHPEGDAWQHTLCVCDASAEIASREQFSPENRIVLMFAALCHDLGKPATTEKNAEGRWTSFGHDKAGEEPTISFLKSINAPNWVIENVVPLVVEHMTHVHCDPTPRIVRRLANRLHPSNLNMWSAVCEADHSGRPPIPASNPVLEWLEIGKKVKVDDGKPKPILMGRHLLEIGEKPGKEMGEKLKRAFQAQLDGLFVSPEEGIVWLRDQACNKSIPATA